MIVHVVVPMHRRCLSPDKIAAHMSEMIDPDNDVVTSVTIADTDGYTYTWTRSSSD